ncbi:MAG TPA: hypothetical protein VHL10_08175 [Nitrososphaera sp.]|jgi:hypothetical protein|nr:hypothetical protein [Nitrososphaera sp.]
MSEVALGLAYLKSALANDATLSGYAPGGIRRAMAQPQAPAPYITIKHQDNGMDAPVFGGGRAYSDVYFEVKVWGPASGTAALINAADRIDTLISTAIPVAVSGGTIKACFRSQPLQSDEDPDGEQWSYFGGIYHMFITT